MRDDRNNCEGKGTPVRSAERRDRFISTIVGLVFYEHKAAINYYEIIETWSLGYFFIFLSQGLVVVSSVSVKQPLNC